MARKEFFRIRRLFNIRLMALVGLVAIALLPSKTSFAAHNSDGAFDDTAHVDGLNDAIEQNWIPALEYMTETLTALMMHQALVVGELLDAKHQLETQRLFGKLRAEAHKDYDPSIQMCRYGTNVRSLAATEERSRTNTQIFSQILLQRQTLMGGGAGAGQGGGSSSGGMSLDISMRLDKFRRTYCDPRSNNAKFTDFCLTVAPRDRIDKDIDFTRNFESRYTLDVDFTNPVVTNDEEDIIALTKNLIGHKTFDYVTEDLLARRENFNKILDMRSVYAVRSVAQNSISHLVGMKARGTGEVGPFMRWVMVEMGIPAADVDAFLGQNPSYFAQMDVLTRKMYQNPVFYTNLYTKPENVKRTGVAIQAIQLMQDRDRFEAALRREMLVSMMLEMSLRESQAEMQADLKDMRTNMFRN